MTGVYKRQSQQFLVVRIHERCGAAFAMEAVAEVTRPLPVEPVAGVPAFVRGLAVIRGVPTPVMELSGLLGLAAHAEIQRFLVVRAGQRKVALAVESVLGFETLQNAGLRQAPPLFRDAPGDCMSAIGALDRELLLVLETARLLPKDLWLTIDRLTSGVS